METKILPVGIDDFEKLRKQNYYYVDKTFFISTLLHNRGEVNLFARPRRFGKTLAMSWPHKWQRNVCGCLFWNKDR